MKPDVKSILIGQIIWNEVGQALADQVKQRIRNNPNARWHKTGTLLNSIKSIEKKGGQLVVTVSDRLEVDKTAEMFADEILKDYLDKDVQQEIAKAIHNAFTVVK